MRQIMDTRITTDGMQITSLRFLVAGKTGTHNVAWLGDTWRCTCEGFIFGGKCRHISMGRIMLNKLNEGVRIISDMEGHNWQ